MNAPLTNTFVPPLGALSDGLKLMADYRALLREVLDNGVLQKNVRTGEEVLTIPPITLTADLRYKHLPVIGVRRLRPKTAAAEVAWFMMGAERISELNRLGCHIWDQFSDPHTGKVPAAYGHRWRHHFGRDQIDEAVRALKSNPTDRRVVVMAWDPGEDGLGRPSPHVPCPVCFVLSPTAGELSMTVVMRSSDIMVGLPYDLMGHALLLDLFAVELDTAPGKVQMVLAHPHIYVKHLDVVRGCLAVADPMPIGPKLPGVSATYVEDHPRDYVDRVSALAKDAVWSAYDPKLVVVS